MWVYKYSKKKSRQEVPKFWTFLKENQDSLKFWLENMAEVPEDRIPFSLRFLQFWTSICILFVVLCWFINPQGSYYQE